jgi:regulatory protein
MNKEDEIRNQVPDRNDKELTRARNTAYRYLTYRPRSQAEIVQKLHDREFNDAIIEAVIEDLARFGYVNDRQFADQWASSRIRLRGFGRRRVEQELKNKGIDRDIIKEVLGKLFIDGIEIETAKLVAGKKRAAMKSLDRKTRRRRLAGFLERKGFSFETILMVLRDIDNN